MRFPLILSFVAAAIIGFQGGNFAQAQPDEPSAPTARLMAEVYQKAVGTLPSAQKDALINALRGQVVTGGGYAAMAGRAVAAFAGVGNCTRHFYNRTRHFWSVALINSGFCKLDGTPGTIDGEYQVNVCMVPPNGTATLAYRNSGAHVGAKIAVVGTWPAASYAQIFNLREVGCYITHSGRTGNAILNDPADGDVAVYCDNC